MTLTPHSQDDAPAVEADSDTDEYGGFLFERLHERLPEKKSNLAQFRQHLVNTSAVIKPLKVSCGWCTLLICVHVL